MSSEPATQRWEFADGWILMSIWSGYPQSVRLDELICAADMMNHAIPTCDELSASLSKLASARVIRVQGDQFSVQDEHADSLAAASRARGGLFATPSKGVGWLERQHFPVADAGIQVTISEAQMRTAYHRYRRRTAG